MAADLLATLGAASKRGACGLRLPASWTRSANTVPISFTVLPKAFTSPPATGM